MSENLKVTVKLMPNRRLHCMDGCTLLLIRRIIAAPIGGGEKREEEKERQIQKTRVPNRPKRQRKDRTPERETTDTTIQPPESTKLQLFCSRGSNTLYQVATLYLQILQRQREREKEDQGVKEINRS